jgi:hypothetical protein
MIEKGREHLNQLEDLMVRRHEEAVDVGQIIVALLLRRIPNPCIERRT